MQLRRPVLNEGETAVLDLRPHWSVLAAPAGAAIASVGITIAVIIIFPSAPIEVAYALFALIAVSIVWLAVRYVKRETTRFIVSSVRILQTSGVLSKKGQEVPLDRLNDVSYRQSLIGRVLGFGDLVLVPGGEGDRMVFHKVWRPTVCQQVIANQIAHLHSRSTDRATGRAPLSIPEQIEKLDELCRRGVITKAEFDAKKAQLLDRM